MKKVILGLVLVIFTLTSSCKSDYETTFKRTPDINNGTLGFFKGMTYDEADYIVHLNSLKSIMDYKSVFPSIGFITPKLKFIYYKNLLESVQIIFTIDDNISYTQLNILDSRLGVATGIKYKKNFEHYFVTINADVTLKLIVEDKSDFEITGVLNIK